MSIEDMQRVTGVEPHQGQQLVLDSDSAIRVVAKGRVWGGTELIISDALRKAQNNRGITAWIIEPQEQMAKTVGERIEKYVEDSDESSEIVQEISNKELLLTNGSIIRYRSAHAFSTRSKYHGEHPEYIAVDEADNLDPGIRAGVDGMLRESVEWRLLVGTPFGYAEVPEESKYEPSWMYQWFKRGFLVGTGTESWRFPTTSSLLVTRDHLDEMRQQVPIDVAAQEYDARWMQHPEMRA